MEIQGGELPVLHGASNLLKNQRVSILDTAVNSHEYHKTPASFHDISSHLHLYGYSLSVLYQIAHSPASPIGWAEAIFISLRIPEKLAPSHPGEPRAVRRSPAGSGSVSVNIAGKRQALPPTRIIIRNHTAALVLYFPDEWCHFRRHGSILSIRERSH